MMAIVTPVAVVSTTSVRTRSGGVLPSVARALGTASCSRVTLRLDGTSMRARTASASVVLGISVMDNGCLVYGQPCGEC